MASKKLPDIESASESRNVTSEVEFWLQQFQKHFAIAFYDRCQSLPDTPGHDEIQRVTSEALVETLLDSGTSPESLIDAVGQVQLERTLEAATWTEEMNQRRVELIDRDLQQSATLDEQVELAKLTATMRAAIDTESNLPLLGAKRLHEKLLKMGDQE